MLGLNQVFSLQAFPPNELSWPQSSFPASGIPAQLTCLASIKFSRLRHSCPTNLLGLNQVFSPQAFPPNKLSWPQSSFPASGIPAQLTCLASIKFSRLRHSYPTNFLGLNQVFLPQAFPPNNFAWPQSSFLASGILPNKFSWPQPSFLASGIPAQLTCLASIKFSRLRHSRPTNLLGLNPVFPPQAFLPNNFAWPQPSFPASGIPAQQFCLASTEFSRLRHSCPTNLLGLNPVFPPQAFPPNKLSWPQSSFPASDIPAQQFCLASIKFSRLRHSAQQIFLASTEFSRFRHSRQQILLGLNYIFPPQAFLPRNAKAT